MNITACPTALVRPFASMIAALGLVGSPLLATAAMAQMQGFDDVQAIAANSLDVSESAQNLENGVYLFGEVPQPDQVGAAYLVMEVQGQTVVGGLYMPYSSFDCFQGAVEGDRLNLNITNSYDLSTYAYTMNLSDSGTVASANPTAAPTQLEGYHVLPVVSDNDLRILETCKADYQS